jgi:hypothetical protein
MLIMKYLNGIFVVRSETLCWLWWGEGLYQLKKPLRLDLHLAYIYKTLHSYSGIQNPYFDRRLEFWTADVLGLDFIAAFIVICLG